MMGMRASIACGICCIPYPSSIFTCHHRRSRNDPLAFVTLRKDSIKLCTDHSHLFGFSYSWPKTTHAVASDCSLFGAFIATVKFRETRFLSWGSVSIFFIFSFLDETRKSWWQLSRKLRCIRHLQKFRTRGISGRIFEGISSLFVYDSAHTFLVNIPFCF